MKKITILLLFFLISLSSPVLGLGIYIKNDGTYNLILNPAIDVKIKKIIIRVDTDNPIDRRFLGIPTKNDQEITVDKLNIGVSYVITATYITQDNESLDGLDMLYFVLTNDKEINGKYNFYYISLLPGENEKSPMEKKSKKISI